MSNAAVSPASIALCNSVSRYRIRRASWRGILSMSRCACAVKRVTYPMRSVLTGAEEGGHLLEGHRPLQAFGLGFVSQPVEPGVLGVLGDTAQPLVLLDVDHDGLLLAPPRDDRRGLLAPGTIDDVGKVASDLGHGFNHRFTHVTNVADVHLLRPRSRTPPRPSCPGRPGVGASPSGWRARRPG